jgi:hypothetical protein
MIRGYEDEANYRKEQQKRRKMEEIEADRKRLEGMGNQEEQEHKLKNDQKKKLLNEQLNDLDEFNRKKARDQQKKLAEDELNRQLFAEQDRRMLEPLNQYKDRLNNMNNRIYGNVYKYNGILNSPIDNDAFNAKDDYEFNRRIAEQRARERDDRRRNPEGLEERLRDMEQNKYDKGDDLLEKRNNQRLYKQYLDGQNEANYLKKKSQPQEDTRPQLIMPAYWYPNRPIPINRKARDSLLFSKNQNQYFDKDMNKFFRWDSQYNTLMDYDNSGRYLGDSDLRHNPITCPVNDYYYNKYVNKLKKNSEYIPGVDPPPLNMNQAYQYQQPKQQRSDNYVI